MENLRWTKRRQEGDSPKVGEKKRRGVENLSTEASEAEGERKWGEVNVTSSGRQALGSSN